MSSPGNAVADKKLAYEGVEVVALPPARPQTPPSPPRSLMTPPLTGDRRTLSMSAAFENSPRTRLAISESMEQVEMITPPRPVHKKTTASAAAAINTITKNINTAGGAAKIKNDHKQRHQRQSSSLSSKSSNNATKNASAITTTNPKSNQAGKKKKMTYVQMAKKGYQELVHAIIRPPRSIYPLEALGADQFQFCGKSFERKDFGVVNERGLLIECSMWQRVQEDTEEGGDCYEVHHHVDREEEERETFERQESELTDATPMRGKIQFIPQPRNSSSLTDVASVDSIEKGQLLYVTMPDSNETEDTAVSSTPSKPQSDTPDNVSPGPHRSSVFSPEAKSSRSNEEPMQSAAASSTSSSSRSRHLERRPVVIYLHGNSSSRTEVIPQLGHLLALGLTVVAFDFCGSGRSEGDFVSLGYYEREDLQTVINYLRASGTSSIALWGRSMGAATALMYGSRDNTISCMILDSPFIDLATLAQELVERGKQHGVHVPQIVVSMVMRMLKSSVKQEARFNIKHISPVSHAPKCFIPAMIVAGEHDDFINKRHAEVIHRQYAGDKNLVIVDGDHNSPRPRYMVQGAMLFLQSCMKVSASLELIVPPNTSLIAPPWLSPENLRNLSASLKLRRGKGGGRSWLSAEDPMQSSSQEGKKQQHRQRPPAPPLLNHEDGVCFSRSSTDVSRNSAQQNNSVAPHDETGATLPDMSKRQREIQSSLFKMLGENELPVS